VDGWKSGLLKEWKNGFLEENALLKRIARYLFMA